jgi:Amt family ammonium transporter
VSPAGAFALGAIAGVICVVSVDFLEYLRIDDPVGAVSVHGVCGIWGTLSLGLFATGQFGAPGPYGADTSRELLVTGLFYSGGWNQLVAQAFGSLCITTATFSTSLVMMYALKAMGVLRLSEERERMGMDVTEHGAPAYPELVPRDAADPRRDMLVPGTMGMVAPATRSALR